MKNLGLLVAAFLIGTQAWATPAQVILIRHAEKPATGKDLSPQGYERARALVSFFEENDEVAQYGAPVAIFAMSDAGNRTRRPIETVQPLARALGVELHEVAEDQSNSMVRAILSNPAFDRKSVLISWVHDDIPDIAHKFGATQAPDHWDESAYDRIWLIRFSDGSVSQFEDLPQRLLPDDSSN